MIRCITTLFLVLLVTMVTACSSGGGPLTPDEPGGSALSSQFPFYVSPSLEESKIATGALGVYQVTINNDNLSYEMVPVRRSSFVPSEYETDITVALTSTFCSDCFIIKGISLNADENIVLSVGAKHPFEQITQLPAPKPQRPDLHIFDVQGIAIVEGATSFPRSSITLNPDFILNADGFTTVFDAEMDALGGPFTTAANAHPFKILSKGDYVNPGDDIGNYDPSSLNGYPNPSGIMDPTGFNVMKCGSDYFTTDYEIKSAGATTSFIFMITCSFGQSAKGIGTDLQKRDNPVYLLPAFSKPEAWMVDVEVENNNLADNDNTSSADVVVRVADWQEAYGLTPANPGFDPAVDLIAARNTLILASGIDNIEVDIPFLNLPVDDTTTLGIIPTGDATYLIPRTYRIPVNNDTFASEIPDPNNTPQFWGLVAVRDDLNGTPNPAGGIDRDLLVPDSMFAIGDYTTYQTFGISIFPPNDPPVPIITHSSLLPPPYAITSGDSPDFDGNSSSDTDGAIIEYEWDFDYDIITGNFALLSDPEYWTDSDPTIAADPPAWKMFNLFDVPASKYVALRVTDDSVGAATSVTYVEVQLTANQPPTADVGVSFYTTQMTAAPYVFYTDERVTLQPGPLTDDDGDITTYQYDFYYDLITFTVDGANTNGAPVLSNPVVMGSVEMGTRVIDNGIPSLTGINSKTITVMDTAVHVPVQVSTVGASGVNLDSTGYHAIAIGATTIVCVWTQTGNMADIFYSTSPDSGATWTAPAVLNSTTSGTQQNATLAVDPGADTFYATFRDNSTGSYNVTYAVSNAGATAWPTQGTVTLVGSGPNDPAVCVNPAAVPTQIYVTYLTTLAANKEIIVQTSIDGGATWNVPAGGINTSNVNDRTNPCIAWSTVANEVGVSWDDFRDGSLYQIYFNWSTSAGTAFQAADIQVSPSANGQNDPSLIDNAGTWAMTFDELGPTEIFFTSSADGITWTTPVDVTDNSDSLHNNSSICVDFAGTYYVTTRDRRETGNPSMADIYIFKSLDSGVTWVRGVRANDRTGAENAYDPNIVGFPTTTGFIVMYESPDDTVYCAVGNAY